VETMLVLFAEQEGATNWSSVGSFGLEKGTSKSFYADFLVSKDDLVFALDPKGDHLITRAAAQRGRRKVVVRLITGGRWADPFSK
jgi:hypothetical protein